MVISYPELLSGRRKAGKRVAVIGAGGIGYDVAEYLMHPRHARAPSSVDALPGRVGRRPVRYVAGGLRAGAAEPTPRREVTVLQRKPDKPGRTLGVSTGWALKARLARQQVRMLTGCHYRRIDDDGLHLTTTASRRRSAVDSVIVCAGQESERSLNDALRAAGIEATLIGGADFAEELDALRAIDQGTRLAWSF